VAFQEVLQPVQVLPAAHKQGVVVMGARQEDQLLRLVGGFVQTMGFWSPAVLVGDARRHGVRMLPVDIRRSRGRYALEGAGIRLLCHTTLDALLHHFVILPRSWLSYNSQRADKRKGE